LDIQARRDELLRSLRLSKPKQIIQSLVFLNSLAIQSHQKHQSFNFPSNRLSADTLQLHIGLLPLKTSLIKNADTLISLQESLLNLPKREYTTTEAKCRALRAARAEALDQLDEILSTETNGTLEECNHDILAAKELIVHSLSSPIFLFYLAVI